MIIKLSTFAKRLQEAIDLSPLSRSDLARATGLSKSTITRYCRGDFEAKQDALQDALYLLAKALDVNETWLMGYDAPMKKDSAPTPTPSNIIPIPVTKKVPLLGTIACGSPILAVENASEYSEMPDFINADFALRCKGDSMITARIFDGDIVFIKSQPVVENGEIAAVLIEDEATLKRVYFAPESELLILRACNPLYPDMEYKGQELEEVRILGKAVHFLSTVRHYK